MPSVAEATGGKERPWTQRQMIWVPILISLCTCWNEPEKTPFLFWSSITTLLTGIPNPALMIFQVSLRIKWAHLKHVKHNSCYYVSLMKAVGMSPCSSWSFVDSKHCAGQGICTQSPFEDEWGSRCWLLKWVTGLNALQKDHFQDR